MIQHKKHKYNKPQMEIVMIKGKLHLLQASLPEQESMPLNDEEEVTTEQW